MKTAFCILALCLGFMSHAEPDNRLYLPAAKVAEFRSGDMDVFLYNLMGTVRLYLRPPCGF